MPKLINGTMVLSLEEAINPAILKGYGAEVTKQDDDVVTIKFPTMHNASSWASMARLEAQTWPAKEILSFKDWVTVDVMHPDVPADPCPSCTFDGLQIDGPPHTCIEGR